MFASSKIFKYLQWTTMVSLLSGAGLLPPTLAEEARGIEAASADLAKLTSDAETPVPEPKADSPREIADPAETEAKTDSPEEIAEPRSPVLWVPETDAAKPTDAAKEAKATKEEANAAAQAHSTSPTDAAKPANPPTRQTGTATPSTESVGATPPALEGPAAWHRAKMRLSGSLCTTCMLTLEKKIKNVAGVNQVKVDRPGAVYRQSMSPDVMSWAQGIIIYDGRQANIDGIRAVIKEAGYHPYQIEDRPLDHEPIARDLKF